MQNGSAELPVALLLYVLNLYVEAKFSRIFGTPVLVNFDSYCGVQKCTPEK